MTVKTPAPPPLPDELDRLLRRLRMPYVRRAAPEVIATATAQRWEHAEVLRVLLTEEVLRRLGGEVTARLYPNMGHTVNRDEVAFIQKMMAAVSGMETGR